MHYDPRETLAPEPLAYNPFNALVAPRPIAWVSTISSAGASNLAPFSYYCGVSSDPPVVVVAPNEKDDKGTPKDTLRNLRDVPEFVVNVVTSDLQEKMNESSAEFDYGRDEFLELDIEATDSVAVRPRRVAAAKAALECKVCDIVQLPTRPGGRQSRLVIGEVVRIHIADELINKDGLIDMSRLPLLSRLGYFDYAAIDDVFVIPRPAAP